jgi:adenylate kinase family enzyme
MTPKIFFVLGGPGSGKGTTCNLIHKTLNFCHVSLGDLIRKYMDDNPTSLNTLKYRLLLLDGKLLPLDDVTDFLIKYIEENDNKNQGLLIDGYPRSLEQLDMFVKRYGKTLHEQPHIHFLYINTPSDVMVQRVINRMRDTYDNDIKITEKRISNYNIDTIPVIEYFKAQHQTNYLELNGLNNININVKMFEKYIS